MEGERGLVDASSFILIEATGDSESDYYDTPLPELGSEDDAESCSFGSLSDGAAADGGRGDDFLDTDDFDDYVEEDGCGEVEDGVVDQCRGGAAAAELNKSKGCEDSKMKDRLFWEACLAS